MTANRFVFHIWIHNNDNFVYHTRCVYKSNRTRLYRSKIYWL